MEASVASENGATRLALAHVEQPDGKVVLTPWTETDFRTDTKPWWK